MFRRAFPFIVLLIAVLPSGCKPELPAGFIVLPGAEGTSNYYVRGMSKALYRMRAEFPAEKQIADITSALKKMGYEPMDHLYLDPQEPAGVKQGWTFYEQTNKRGIGWMVYDWSTDFSDRNGNIITYTLEYRDPIEKYRKGTFVMKPGNDNLVVNFIYMPREVALSVKETRAAQQKKAEEEEEGK